VRALDKQGVAPRARKIFSARALSRAPVKVLAVRRIAGCAPRHPSGVQPANDEKSTRSAAHVPLSSFSARFSPRRRVATVAASPKEQRP